MVRAIRGATTVENNDREEIIEATKEMLETIISENNIKTEDMVSVIFTVTPDLDKVFPAVAARKMGIVDVPLLDMSEPEIDGALKKCIRILMHVNSDKQNKRIFKGCNGVASRFGKINLKENKMKYISVAVDGPAGAGKSSVSKAVAKSLGYTYIDTGAMYRAVALFAINNGIDAKNETEKLVSRLNEVEIDIKYTDEGQQIYLLGENVSKRIREEDVSVGASNVAVIPEVRKKLVELQRKMAESANVIMDGRDICSYVLPNADVKIFLTASAESRAKRRYDELCEKGIECDFEKIKADMEYRDKNDSQRAVAPLKKADDATLIDTTEYDFDGAVKLVKDLILEKTEG